MESSFDGRYTNANEGKLQFRLKQDNIAASQGLDDTAVASERSPIFATS
jgi:hypothetical protein